MLLIQNKLTFLDIFFAGVCLASSYWTIVVTLTRKTLERQGKMSWRAQNITSNPSPQAVPCRFCCLTGPGPSPEPTTCVCHRPGDTQGRKTHERTPQNRIASLWQCPSCSIFWREMVLSLQTSVGRRSKGTYEKTGVTFRPLLPHCKAPTSHLYLSFVTTFSDKPKGQELLCFKHLNSSTAHDPPQQMLGDLYVILLVTHFSLLYPSSLTFSLKLLNSNQLNKNRN